jgi:hypothetical protein
VAPLVKTAWLAAAVARVTGDSGKKVNEGARYRVTVTSNDGHKCGVSVQVNTHTKEARPYQLNEIADRWHVNRTELTNVLNEWTSDQLKAHLSTFAKEALMPPRFSQANRQPPTSSRADDDGPPE